MTMKACLKRCVFEEVLKPCTVVVKLQLYHAPIMTLNTIKIFLDSTPGVPAFMRFCPHSDYCQFEFEVNISIRITTAALKTSKWSVSHPEHLMVILWSFVGHPEHLMLILWSSVGHPEHLMVILWSICCRDILVVVKHQGARPGEHTQSTVGR